VHKGDGVRTTNSLHECNIEHAVYGKSTKTLCVSCIEAYSKVGNWFYRIEITPNTPHTSCNQCGAITKEDYATRYS